MIRQNDKTSLQSVKQTEPKKRGRKRKIVQVATDVQKPNEEQSSEYAYKTITDNMNYYVHNEEDFSNIPDDHMEKIVTYEPALSTECQLDLPPVFIKQAENTTPVEWPMTSKLCCINCTRKIPGIPWLIPIGKIRGMYIMSNDGVGCRYECALRRIIEINDFHCTTQASYLADIAIRYFGMNRSNLKAGNPRTMLDCFSGTGITLEAYHDNMTHPEMAVNIRLPPFIPSTMVFEKKHPNESRWKVQGLRVPDKKERDRIYREERVVGSQPYPGQVSMYEKVFTNYYPKAIATKVNTVSHEKPIDKENSNSNKNDQTNNNNNNNGCKIPTNNDDSTCPKEPIEIKDDIAESLNDDKKLAAISTPLKTTKKQKPSKRFKIGSNENASFSNNSMAFLFRKKSNKNKKS